MNIKEIIYCHFGTRIYLPISAWIRRMKRSRKSASRFIQLTLLPEADWRECCAPAKPARLCETEKLNGNVRLSELAILSSLATACKDGSNIVEIGTFDGRTALNLALNSPPRCRVYTLDLPPGANAPDDVDEGERHLIENRAPGFRIENNRESRPEAVAKITRIFGNSATFDWTPYEGNCSLVFVDGSHAYDYLRRDSEAALRLVGEHGVVVWHDYGVWADVTTALEDLEQERGLGLRNIAGTSLAIMTPRIPETQQSPAMQPTGGNSQARQPAWGMAPVFPALLTCLVLATYLVMLLPPSTRLSEFTFDALYGQGGVMDVSTVCLWLGIAAVMLSRCRHPGWPQSLAAIILSFAAAILQSGWGRTIAPDGAWNIGGYFQNAPLDQKMIIAALAAGLVVAFALFLLNTVRFLNKGGFDVPAGQLLIIGLGTLLLSQLPDLAPVLHDWISQKGYELHARRLLHAFGEGLELAAPAILLTAVLWQGSSVRFIFTRRRGRHAH